MRPSLSCQIALKILRNRWLPFNSEGNQTDAIDISHAKCLVKTVEIDKEINIL